MNNNWQSLRKMSSDCMVKNDWQGAVQFLKEAIVLSEKNDPAETALMYNGLANLYLKQGAFSLAESAARSSIRIEHEFGDRSKNTNLASYYMMLAVLVEKQGGRAKALENIEVALDLYLSHGGADLDFISNIRRYQASVKQNVWRG